MVSAVAPVYRNAAALDELVARVSAWADEIVLVDDGCPDGSWEVIASLDGVRGIRHGANRGQNEAVLTGLRAAAGDVVVVMDADLQDPPEAVPALLAELERHGGVVFGGRRGVYEPWTRRASSVVFKRLLSAVSPLPPDAGLFLAMDRPAAEATLAQARPGGYVLAAIARTGAPMRSVPVDRGPAVQSGYSTIDRVRLGLRALKEAVAP
jgi:polyisoprenyl-phosphate glycosyltransferase